jgi:uncharacterized OsmC-like protein
MEHYMTLARTADDESAAEHYAGRSNQIDRYLSVSRFREHEVRIDEPKEFGGGDTAANPAEMLLGALCASMEVTCRAWAEYLAIPCGSISTTVTGTLDVRGFMDTHPNVRAGFTEIVAEMRLSGPVSPGQLAELERLIARCCPILDSIRDGSPIAVKISSAVGTTSPPG